MLRDQTIPKKLVEGDMAIGVARDVDHPGLEAADVIGIVGGDVLEIAGHRIEAKAASGIDIAQPHSSFAPKNPARSR